MKAQLVQMVDGQFVETIVDIFDLAPAMEVRGYEFIGLTESPRLRPELQGQPKFSGVVGPMWGGNRDGEDMIRYECPNTYRAMSA